MTKQRDFKQRVRARMKKTGERYAAARAQLLDDPTAAVRGAFDGYERFGGVHGDTGAVANCLRQAGIVSPLDGEPFDEAFVSGLCGGVGFLYAVFEYKGLPPLLSLLLRHQSMPDTFVMGGLARLPVKLATHETSGAATARKTLDAAIDAGKPAICVADQAHLGYYGMPETMAGMSPTVLAVAGADGDDVWLDDRGATPWRVARDRFEKARGAYRKAKHRLVTIEGPLDDYDLDGAVRDALRATARGFSEAPVPSFASNFGWNGLEKWRRLLTDPKDKKGWPRLFGEGSEAYAGLRRVYDWIEFEYTAPAAGRAFYAEFLDAASKLDGLDALRDVAASFRESGERWRAISDLVAHCGDETIEAGCAISDRRFELMDGDGEPPRELTELWTERFNAGKACAISRERAGEIFEAIANTLGDILEIERGAVARLTDLVG